MSKSPDAFRTISEVADWLGIQAHVLRFWESKFTQVKPIKRAGGRRYYRPADMLLLGGIRKLLHDDGLTIKGVQKLLREEGMNHVSAMSLPLDDLDLEEEVAAPTASIPPPAAEPEEAVVLQFEAPKTSETPAPAEQVEEADASQPEAQSKDEPEIEDQNADASEAEEIAVKQDDAAAEAPRASDEAMVQATPESGGETTEPAPMDAQPQEIPAEQSTETPAPVFEPETVGDPSAETETAAPPVAADLQETVANSDSDAPQETIDAVEEPATEEAEPEAKTPVKVPPAEDKPQTPVSVQSENSDEPGLPFHVEPEPETEQVNTESVSVEEAPTLPEETVHAADAETAPEEQPEIAPTMADAEDQSTQQPAEPTSDEADTPEEVNTPLPSFMRQPNLDTPPLDEAPEQPDPAPEAAQEPEAPPAPKARDIGMPVVTPESEIHAQAAALAMAYCARKLDKATAEKIQPLLDQLMAVRDRMAARRTGA